MAKTRVTRIRSSTKRLKTQKLTSEALGLKRIGFTTKHETTPSILRMMNKVKHLISIEEVK